VRIDDVDVDHQGVKFPPGQWISEQRREYAAGRLATTQVEKLDEPGWCGPSTTAPGRTALP